MKKLIVLLILVIVCGTMMVTCPDKEAHMTALINEVTTFLDKERMGEDSLNQEKSSFEKGLNIMLYSLAGSFVKTMIEQELVVKNNFIYSTGEINSNSGSRLVSLGLLGHVFVFLDADKIKESLNEEIEKELK